VLIAILCAIGLLVLAQLNATAAMVALVSVAPVAAYPFMKRITWWPQAWLGLVFSWGALVGWPAVAGSLDLPALLLWFGSIAWVVGYDTLYAIQDIEDDALVGVKSSARRLGDKAPLGVAIFYLIAVLFWAAALWSVRPDWLALLALAPAAIHLANQALRADPKDGEGALRLFRSNRSAGFLIFLAMLVVGLSSR
jgi:4-hydroxybenzoate polyprenyltransferase